MAILVFNRPHAAAIMDVYREAEEETRFDPTYFLVYDKSLADRCDRLVVVEPFGWLIWAINNNVYILENTSGIICPLGSSSAIKVTRDTTQMTSECINITPIALLNLYNSPTRIGYDVTDCKHPNKFTVLDALNILFRSIITISFDDGDDEQQPTIKTMNASRVPPHQQISSATANLYENFSRISFLKESEVYSRVYTSSSLPLPEIV